MNKWLVEFALCRLLEEKIDSNPEARDVIKQNWDEVVRSLVTTGEVSLPTPIGKFRLNADFTDSPAVKETPEEPSSLVGTHFGTQ